MNISVAIIVVAGCVAAATVLQVLINGVVRIRLHRPPPPDRELIERLARMESALDAVAIEVERISESQRFTARLASGAPPDETR